MKRLLIGLLILTVIQVQAQQTAPITEAMNNFDYATAIDLIEQEEPTPELLFQKAKAYKGLYRYNEAVDVLETINSENPENKQMLLELAECSRMAGKFNQALKSYESLLKIDSGHFYARTQYINLLFMLDKYAQAEKICTEAAANDSSIVFTRLMAQCYEGMLDTDSAKVWYQKVVNREPGDYFAVSKLASLHIQGNEISEAIKITKKYREKDTTNIYVNRQNAQAYCLDQQFDKAIVRYEQLLNQGDSSRYTCFYAGMSYFAEEKFYEAHDCLEIALKYDPKNVNILYYLARSCAKTSWKKEGVEYMKLALEYTIPSDDNLAKLYSGLAECYHRNTEWKNYIDALQMQRKHEPDKHFLLYRIGAAYQDFLNDNKNAIRYLEMYLKTKPEGNKDQDPAMEGGAIVADDKATYRAAENRLKAIREEQFFKEGVKEENGK